MVQKERNYKLFQNASLLTIMIGGQSVCEWIYIQHTREQELLLKRTHLPNVRSVLGISQFPYRLQISDTKRDGQMGGTSGSYFGGLGFKPRQADNHNSEE